MVAKKNRLAKLLDMMYRPKELAEEIGFSVRQVYRVYIPLGLPHKKNDRGLIYIHGVTFREWITEFYKKREMKNNEMFCLTCKKPVEMINPAKYQEERIVYYVCACPHCGRVSARILQQKRRGYDQSG